MTPASANQHTNPSLAFNLILAIESSCDETAISIVEAKWGNSKIPIELCVRAHIVESQNEIHQPFGGVVPEVAARDHLAKIHSLAQKALNEAQIDVHKLDAIAVTLGPGLIGALMVGVLFARGLALSLNKPLLGINHVDAHLDPTFLFHQFSPQNDLHQWLKVPERNWPALALTVSGGHCHLSQVNSPFDRVILGKTADDACGEAFDKVAKLLGLPYPGGPELEKLASKVTESRFKFPTILSDRSNRYGFSFSGVKTAVLEAVRKETTQHKGRVSGAMLPDDLKAELAFAFQEAALGQLIHRMQNAIADHPDFFKCALVAGGVAANQRFKELLNTLPIPVFIAPLSLCSDNATMIATHAFLDWQDGFENHAFPRYQSATTLS